MPGLWLVGLLLSLSTQLSAQQYLFQRQIGPTIPGTVQLSAPSDVEVDSRGNLYVVDSPNRRVVKLSSSDSLLVAFGSEGTEDGQFQYPVSVAVDAGGNIYVSAANPSYDDTHIHSIQKFDSSGRFLFKFGSYGSGQGQFQGPYGLVVDSKGHLYVADQGNHRIQKFDSTGHFLLQFGSYGYGNGKFRNPKGLAIDRKGNLYVADSENNRIQVFDSSGHFLSKIGSAGNGPGQLRVPYDVVVDDKGNVFVADLYNHRIQQFDSSGHFLAQIGQYGYRDGQFRSPVGVALSGSGNLYVADQGNHRVQVFAYGPCSSLTPATGATLPSATFGKAYRQAITTEFSGYTFSATGLPAGLSISSQGIITGTPTATTTVPDTVVVTATQGSCQASATYYLTVNPFLGGKVVSFTLIDARTGKDLHPLSEGEVLNLLKLPDQLSIRANTDPTEIGSVVFNLNGKPRFQVENFAPYALASNNADDSYVPYAFQPGDYTLSATSYSQGNGQGEKGYSLTIHFQVIKPRVTGFTLVNTDTGGTVQPLQEGDVLDLAKLPAHLSVRANTDPAAVGSVMFGLNDQPKVRVENFPPYALASNLSDGGHLLFQFGGFGSGNDKFETPVGVAVNSLGNVYVADAVIPNDYGIKVFDSTGHNLFAFSSYVDGQFFYSSAVAVDGSDDVYVVDGPGKRILKFSPEGRFLFQFGSYGSGQGQFNYPAGVALDGSKNIYISDVRSHRVQKFDSTGHFLSQIGSQGNGEGQFNSPAGLAVDGSGNLYVADAGNQRIQKFSPTGQFIFQFGSQGTGEGQFSYAWGVAVDVSNTIYVTDPNNQRTQAFDALGHFLSQFSSFSSDEEKFYHPGGVAVDYAGNVYVTDIDNYRIQKFSTAGSYLPYAFKAGNYTLTATPYSQANGQGDKEIGLTVNFWVINSASSARVSVAEGRLLEVMAYPNPFGEKLYAVIKSPVSQPVEVHCYDAKGVEVGRLYEGELKAGQAHRVELDGRTWPDGLYFLRVSTSQQQLVKKVVLLRK